MSRKKVVAPGSALRSFTQILTSPQEAGRAGQQGSRYDPNLRAREDARREGYEEGLAKGREEGRSEAYRDHSKDLELRADRLEAAAVECLDELRRRFILAMDEFRSDMTERMTSISAAIAERVICREIAASPEIVVGIVATALNEVMHGARVIVRANPFDAELLRARQADIERAVAHLESLEVVDDPSIRAGCVIDTDGCLIDARIDAMLERVGSAIRSSAEPGIDGERADAPELSAIEGGLLIEREAA